MRKKFSDEKTKESIEAVVSWAKGPFSRRKTIQKTDGSVEWFIKNVYDEFGPLRYAELIEKHPSYKYSTLETFTDEEIKENQKLLDETMEKYDDAWKAYVYLRDAYKQNILTEEQFKECKDAYVGGFFGYPTQMDEIAKQTHLSYSSIEYILKKNISLDSLRQEFKSGKPFSDSADHILKKAIDIDKSDYSYNYLKFIRDTDPTVRVFSSKLFDKMLDEKLDDNEKKIIKSVHGLGESSIIKKKLTQDLNISSQQLNEIEASAIRKIALYNLLEKDYVFTSDDVLDYVASTNAIFIPSKEYRDADTDLDYEKLMELVNIEIDSREGKQDKTELKDEYKLNDLGFSKGALELLEDRGFYTWGDVKEFYIEDAKSCNKKREDEILTAIKNFGGKLKSREEEKRIAQEKEQIAREAKIQEFLDSVKEKVKTTKYEDIKIDEFILPNEYVGSYSYSNRENLIEYLTEKCMFSNLAELAMLSDEELERIFGESRFGIIKQRLESIGVKNGDYQLEPKTKYEDFRNMTIRELKPDERCINAIKKDNHFYRNGYIVGSILDLSPKSYYKIYGVGPKFLNPLLDKVRELYLAVEDKPEVAPKIFEKETVLSREEAINSDLKELFAHKDHMQAELEKLNQKIAEAQQLLANYEKISDKQTVIKDDMNVKTKELEGEEHE